MFISEVVAVNADEKYFDEKTGLFRLNDAVPIMLFTWKVL